MGEFLWYVPNTVAAGHRGDDHAGVQLFWGEPLDSCLYTAPGQFGGGGAGTTWLVGSYDEVAAALRKYADLGVTHFILSDTPYLREVTRLGDELLPRLHGIPA